MATIDQFMTALSGQESGGDYSAENGRTGAYGRFQILPSNWPSWAAEAGLGANAPQTPQNQEYVARFKLQQYFDRFGNWEDVASAWYSGSPLGAYTQEQLTRKQGYGDEPSILEYVNSVMGRMGGSAMADSTFYTRYSEAITKRQALLTRLAPLDDKFAAAETAGAIYQPGIGLVAYAIGPDGNADMTQSKVFMTEQEYQDYYAIDGQLGDIEQQIVGMEQEYEDAGGNIDDFIKRADFTYSTDPRNIDAENAASKFDREMDIRQQATSLANTRLTEQNAVQENNTDALNRFTSGNTFGQVFRAPRTFMPTADDLFNDAVAVVRKGLPEVPDRPYYENRDLPAGQPSLASIRGSILEDIANRQSGGWTGTGATYTGPTFDNNVPGMNDQNPDYQATAKIGRSRGGSWAPLSAPKKSSSAFSRIRDAARSALNPISTFPPALR